MGLREIFFPPKRDFVRMLKEQAEKTAEGMQALQEYLSEPTPERDKKVVRLEDEADEMRRILIEELNLSFVTPFPPHVKPAIGGLGVGLVALFLPQVLSGGYGWIQAAIDGPPCRPNCCWLWSLGKCWPSP